MILLWWRLSSSVKCQMFWGIPKNYEWRIYFGVFTVFLSLAFISCNMVINKAGQHFSGGGRGEVLCWKINTFLHILFFYSFRKKVYLERNCLRFHLLWNGQQFLQQKLLMLERSYSTIMVVVQNRYLPLIVIG